MTGPGIVRLGMGLGAGVVVVAVGIGSLRGADAPAATVEAQQVFDHLKELAGDWVGTAMGQATTLRYRVVGAGSALVEEQFPNTPHEMLTIYFMDGAELRMTHYCAAGNQPRLRLDAGGSRAGDYRFVFDGGTNLDPARDHHIHGARVVVKDRDHVESHWFAYADGKPSDDHTAVFTLTRKGK